MKWILTLSFLLSVNSYAGPENWFEGGEPSQEQMRAGEIVPGRSTTVIYSYPQHIGDQQTVRLYINNKYHSSLQVDGGYTVVALCAEENLFTTKGNPANEIQNSQTFSLAPDKVTYLEYNLSAVGESILTEVSEEVGLKAVQDLPQIEHILSRLGPRRCQ